MATNEIPGRVTFLEGNGELPKIEIATPWSDAEIYLQGAHVTHFQRKHEPPLLFMSQCSRFQKGSPIRGGIPVIFPWFGPREGQPQHGFGRMKTWELKEVTPSFCRDRARSQIDAPSTNGTAGSDRFSHTCATKSARNLRASFLREKNLYPASPLI